MQETPKQLTLDHHAGSAVIESVDTVHQRLLEKVRYLDLELRAVSIGLKSKLEKTSLIRDQLTQCVASLPIGVILVDQEGEIQSVNEAAKILCGWQRSDCEGKPLEALWKQLGWPPVPFTNISVESRMLSCWDAVLGTPGSVPCLTARFLMNKERADKDPKDLSRGQTLSILGERVAKITHDLRNSLASVELFASLVERRVCGDPEHQKVAPQLLRSIRSLEQLVSNLSTSSNPRKPKMERVTVASLFDHIGLLLAYPIQSRQIVLHREIAPGAEVIVGDHTLLNQACLNLVNNAIAASSHGGVIDINCHLACPSSDTITGLKGDEYVRIRVQDYGCGIDQEDLPHVCQPFYSKKNSGTGLGLSIVHDVMDAHLGTLDIQSQKGQGTTVSLYFPRQRRLA